MKSNRKWLAWMVPTALSLSVGVGCAHQQPTSQATPEITQVDKLRLRVEEVEQTNGRLNVRIEELEDQIFLLQDMTESNRIALQRNGYMQRGTYLSGRDPQARAPGPTPESYSGEPNPYSAPYDDGYQARQEKRTQRHVTRIPLANSQKPAPAQPAAAAPVEPQGASGDQEPMDEIVITDAEFRAFAGEPPPSARRAESSQSGTRRAQAPVTEEKLATTEHLKAAGAEQSEKTMAAASGNPLSLYKVALAEYRKGNYAEALTGFHAFLNAKPNSNYIDNGLYWIGECHYGLGDYQEANVYFTRVLREQPDGNKVPDAMLKMSLSHERMGQLPRMREWLEKLTDQFPTSNAGRLGAQKLSTLPHEPARN